MTKPNFTAEELAAEEWRVIRDFPKYEVSNLGRVRRRFDCARAKAGNLAALHAPGPKTKARYVSCNLYGESGLADSRRRINVHRLVALAFLGDPPKDREQVNHKDCDTSNNRVENLEWNSAAEDGKHRSLMGRVLKGANHHFVTNPACVPRGSRNARATIDESTARKIKSRLSNGDRPPDIARDLDVSVRVVYHIRYGAWNHA